MKRRMLELEDEPGQLSLRGYQAEAVSACMKAWKEHRRILLVLPTGAGKTITFAAIVKRAVDRGHRVLILAHREELLEQARDKLRAVAGLEAELEKAEHQASRASSVVVASVQSLQGARLASWPADYFGLVIVDEAHHAPSDTYRAILDHFQVRVLGVTATPDRSDRKGLGEVFDAIAYELGLVELIEQGFLARPLVQTLPLAVDLHGVRSSAGDYQVGDLGTKIEPLLAEIIQAALPIVRHRKTLVFCPTIETSRACAYVAAEAGLTAEHIDGTSEDRRAILGRFSASGRGSMLSCCTLLVEGFDEPSADCLLNLRPTKSRTLYAQMVGRVLRTHPGKKNALILDPLWEVGRHNLIRPASLVAMTKDQATTMEGKQGDLLEIAAQAEQDRLKALREAVDQQRGRKSKLIDPLELGVMLNALSLADYEPTFRWHEKRPSSAQLAALGKAGIDTDLVRDRGHACAIMDALVDRRAKELATPKQVRLLVQLHHSCPDKATFTEAMDFLGRRLGKHKPRRPSRPQPLTLTNS